MDALTQVGQFSLRGSNKRYAAAKGRTITDLSCFSFGAFPSNILIRHFLININLSDTQTGSYNISAYIFRTGRYMPDSTTLATLRASGYTLLGDTAADSVPLVISPAPPAGLLGPPNFQLIVPVYARLERETPFVSVLLDDAIGGDDWAAYVAPIIDESDLV